jgi:protein-S-isoprenylcysteine O-methyltransferase
MNNLAFLLNHSLEFNLALLLAITEFMVEAYLVPRMKSLTLYRIGYFITCSSQVLRSLAMITAGKNFNHQVATTKEHDHQLVTTGVYKYLRHPSYTGFFYWGIGLQVMLCNPISFIVYLYALSNFFSFRIPKEELHLLDFFGQNYKDYQSKTFILIPIYEC